MPSQLPLLDPEWLPGDPRDCWATPQKLFDALNQEFEFTIDVASNDYNHKCSTYLTAEGLMASWGQTGDVAFCNPPFSDIESWVKKAWHESQLGIDVVMLLPANRTGRRWFHAWVIGRADEIQFIKGRVQYVAPLGIKTSTCGFDSMIVVYRKGMPDYDRGANTIVGAF